MLKCPKCHRTYDDSWNTCLVCNVNLVHVLESEPEDETNGYEKLGGGKFAIIFYSLLLMIITPIVIFLVYLLYLAAWDVEFIKHGRKQLKEAIVFQEKAKEKREIKDK